MVSRIAPTRSLTPTSRWFVAAGSLSVARAFLELAEPVYYNPETILDYAAVVLTSVALACSAAGLLSLWRSSPLRRGAPFLLVAAAGIVVEATGNLLEDLLDLAIGGDLYSLGGMAGAVGLLLAAATMLTASHRLRWVGLLLLIALAGGTFPDDGGQFLTGVAYIGLALWVRRQPASAG